MANPPPDPSAAFAAWYAARAAGLEGSDELDRLEVAVSAALRGTAARLAPRGCDPDDLLQEAWLRFLPRARAGEFTPGDGVPLRWLRRVLHNLVVDHVRRVARRPLLGDEAVASLVDGTAADVEDEAHRRELQHGVRAALDSLRRESPGRAYDMVELLRQHYVEGRTAEEIALALGKSVNSVEVALVRARKAFLRHYQAGRSESP